MSSSRGLIPIKPYWWLIQYLVPISIPIYSVFLFLYLFRTAALDLEIKGYFAI